MPRILRKNRPIELDDETLQTLADTYYAQGNVRIYKTKGYQPVDPNRQPRPGYTLVVYVSISPDASMDFLNFGGNIGESSYYKPQWKQSGYLARAFLEAIIPYLPMDWKQEQAEIAVDWHRLRDSQPNLFDTLRQYNLQSHEDVIYKLRELEEENTVKGKPNPGTASLEPDPEPEYIYGLGYV